LGWPHATTSSAPETSPIPSRRRSIPLPFFDHASTSPARRRESPPVRLRGARARKPRPGRRPRPARPAQRPARKAPDAHHERDSESGRRLEVERRSLSPWAAQLDGSAPRPA
jgi:hypothetical protein